MKVEEIQALIDAGLFEYGSTYTEEKFCTMFKIQPPRELSFNEFKRYELDKMNIYSSVNKQLLNSGKCFIQDKNNYRVPLLSEIQSHIDKYYRASRNKFSSAEKLRKSFAKLQPVGMKTYQSRDIGRMDSMLRQQDKAYKSLR